MSQLLQNLTVDSRLAQEQVDITLRYLAELFSGETPLHLIRTKQKNGVYSVEAGNEETPVISFFFKQKRKSPVLLFPGAGATRRSKNLLVKKFSFLMEQGHPLVLPQTDNPFPKSDREFFLQIKQQVALMGGAMAFWEEFAGTCNQEFFLIAVSAGAFPGIILATLKRRIRKILLLVSGGDCEGLTWRGLLRFILRKDCPRKACRNMHATYRWILKNSLYSQIPLLPRYCFIYDPLTLAPWVVDREILMINGLFDLVVPFSCAFRLRHRLAHPPLLWYPGTHLMLPWFLPFFRKRIQTLFGAVSKS
ncbi:MAG: hypothetical protein NC911_07645 [Candidatus Omnitrophica bacterium]|nr:hypothetical protein [Candidatus Omnitrophota bacterium]